MKTTVRVLSLMLIAIFALSACMPTAQEVAQELATMQAQETNVQTVLGTATAMAEDDLGQPEITPAVAVETEAPEEPVVATLTSTSASAEGCVGPAILETVVEGKTAVIKIDEGETWSALEGCFGDAYFHGDQSFLDNRFPGHVAEFKAKYPGQDVQVLEVEGDKLAPYESVLLSVPEGTPVPPEEPPATVPTEVTSPPGSPGGSPQPTSKEPYEATPLGSLTSTNPLVIETWGMVNGKAQGYVVIVPAGAIAWLQGHFGQWSAYLESWMDINEKAKEHQGNIRDRDGLEPEIVVLPDQGFPLLGCLQSKPVALEIRHCDSVGGQPAFNVKIGAPYPGHYGSDYDEPVPLPAGADLSTLVAPITTTLTLSDFGTGLTCEGPGIVETSVSGVPAVVAVGDGEVFTYAEGGGFCGGDYFASQAALEARFPDHVTEFQVTYPEARVFVFEDGQLVELP